MIARKNNEYYYAPLRRRWGIWKWHETGNGGFGEFIKEYRTKEDAKAEVYKLNGWS